MTKRTGRHAMLEQLLAEGVTYVFGNPGTTEQAFMDALQDYPQIQYILALNEAAAVGMADGYARASGKPAFVQLHIMPGLGNAMGMLYNSYRMRTPMVVYVGQHPPHGPTQDPILSGDVVRMAAPVTKWAAEAQSARDISSLLRRAFREAMDTPRGPVLLSIPTNLMDEDSSDEDSRIDIALPDERDSQLPPDPGVIQTAVDLILSAKSPFLICGSGVAEAGAQQDAVWLAETIGARIYTPFCPELPVPSTHPLYCSLLNAISEAGLRAQLSAADLIIAVGTPLLPLLFPLKASPFGNQARIVHVASHPEELSKSWPADLVVEGNHKIALAHLLDALNSRMNGSYQEEAAARRRNIEKMNGQMLSAIDAAARRKWENIPIGPGRMMKEISDALAPGTILYDESISVSGYVMRYLRFDRTSTHYRATGGGLGAGIPAPIGMKLARPDQPVVAIVGDGAALYAIQALWTAAHYRVPVTWAVVNNSSYRILKLNMVEYLGRNAPKREFVGMDMTGPEIDFARLAESFGVSALRVNRGEDIGEALRTAQASKEPFLLDVVVDGDIGSSWL